MVPSMHLSLLLVALASIPLPDVQALRRDAREHEEEKKMHVAQGKGKGKLIEGGQELGGRNETEAGGFVPGMPNVSLIEGGQELGGADETEVEEFVEGKVTLMEGGWDDGGREAIEAGANGSLDKMGFGGPCQPQPRAGTPQVVKHCTSLMILGLAYHSSVLVGQDELSFSNNGVSLMCASRKLPSHPVKANCKQVGTTRLSSSQVVQVTQGYFRRGSYHLLRKNCNSYAMVAVPRITGRTLPSSTRWIEDIAMALFLDKTILSAGAPDDGFNLDKAVKEALTAYRTGGRGAPAPSPRPRPGGWFR
eukprot:TRINITY_DN11770_c0_g1_i1.p1 TRINITY_DN11770_c0_g1~~TRINITY_DN11770_c0_g1_i1.p1  ORF type:complete len:306 (-),score=23.65 TRINITY_DN11770_c0_g1_i1:99-1016(-)